MKPFQPGSSAIVSAAVMVAEMGVLKLAKAVYRKETEELISYLQCGNDGVA